MSAPAKREVVIIGGGPAGLAAAIAASEAGCRDILLIERDRRLGGILNQCIHDGFGLHRFGEALSGPEYAARYIKLVGELDVDVMLNTIVLNLSADRDLLLSREGTMEEIEASAVVLAMGCRERARGALSIPGHRPSGVYTAGAAQNFVNMENIMPGNRVVILGSGDIGLIMARRMTLEGAHVEAVFELLPYSSGLPRNIQQCLVDYGIPLHLSTTVVEIVGMGRLEGVVTAKVDERRRPIPGSENFVQCDTLLLSVGLIPENELAREAGVPLDPVTGGPKVDNRCMTGLDGIFSCGNALHVHDLVDWVSEEAARAGRFVAEYVGSRASSKSGRDITVSPGRGIRYVVPETIRWNTLTDGRGTPLCFRVLEPSRNGVAEVLSDGVVIAEEKHGRLHPAEMVRVTLDSKKMRRIAEKGRTTLEVRIR
ncbi:MAG: NAD(P)/FAD-dependent oxidoreductase [Synergistaceae bacterium]|jgi:sarcosine oxidase subunit alpha|nr:NAD(P)/FAD-dependent oxidoreductase [Synergistaceae bacterium]